MANEESERSYAVSVKETREDTTKIKNIVPKGIGYRMVAAIIDFAIALLVGVLIGIFLSSVVIVPIAKATGAVNDAYNQALSDTVNKEEGNNYLFALNPAYSGDSGLSKYVALSDSSVKDSYATYDKYQDNIVKYYTVYLNSDSTYVNATKKGQYTSYWYNVFILGLNDEQHLYSDDELNAREDFIKNSTLFEYKVDGETKLYNEIAVPNKDLYVGDTLSSESETKLLQYYYNSSATSIKKTYTISDSQTEVSYLSCIYEKSMEHWIYESNDPNANNSIYFLFAEWSHAINNYSLYQVTYPTLGAIIITWILAYFVMPIILKNGRTLGKLMFKSAVVNKLGYNVSVPQMALRSLAPLALVIAVYLISAFTIMMMFYLVMMIVLLVSYTLVIFNKDHKSIHDFVAGTIVIDSEKSTWFKSALEEQQYQENLEKEAPKGSSLIKDNPDEDKVIIDKEI